MTTRKSTILPESSRRRQEHGAVTDVDRISHFPVLVLSRILSFLPAKDAVATNILSKRWDDLWTTTVNLDFCCPDPYDYRGDTDYREYRFAKFVNHVLLVHKPGTLERFSLEWTYNCSHSCVNLWITAVVARNVQELFINVDIFLLPIRVQTRIFSCESLRSLELNCHFWFYNEVGVSLPNLESLTLRRTCFENEKAFCKLLNGCPMLKYLVIHTDFGEIIQFDDLVDDGIAFKFIISSTSLQHLELCLYDDPIISSGLCGVQLDAPSLPYIKLIDSADNSLFLQKRLIFLGEAANFQLTSFRQELKDCDSLVEAFHAFGSAKTLILSDFVIRNLSCAMIKMTTRFNRLTRLDVLMNWKYWSSLLDLIELSDNLQVLVVNKDDNVIVGDYLTNSKWKTPDRVPTCLSKSLRTVSIGAYYGHHNALAMVAYILKHGSILQVMKICFHEFISDFKTRFVKKISMFPTKSPDCKLEFC